MGGGSRMCCEVVGGGEERRGEERRGEEDVFKGKIWSRVIKAEGATICYKL